MAEDGVVSPPGRHGQPGSLKKRLGVDCPQGRDRGPQLHPVRLLQWKMGSVTAQEMWKCSMRDLSAGG